LRLEVIRQADPPACPPSCRGSPGVVNTLCPSGPSATIA